MNPVIVLVVSTNSSFLVVDLPDEPDGKGVEITFGREGLVEVSTQTKPLGVGFLVFRNHMGRGVLK